MQAVIDTVKDLSSTADEATRKKIIITLRDLAYSIESHDDTIGRIMFLVSLVIYPKLDGANNIQDLGLIDEF